MYLQVLDEMVLFNGIAMICFGISLLILHLVIGKSTERGITKVFQKDQEITTTAISKLYHGHQRIWKYFYHLSFSFGGIFLVYAFVYIMDYPLLSLLSIPFVLGYGIRKMPEIKPTSIGETEKYY